MYVIDRARNGVVVVVSKFIEEITLNHLILFLGSAFVVGGLATFLTLYLSKIFSKVIDKINYNKISIFIIAFIIWVEDAVEIFFGNDSYELIPNHYQRAADVLFVQQPSDLLIRGLRADGDNLSFHDFFDFHRI